MQSSNLPRIVRELVSVQLPLTGILVIAAVAAAHMTGSAAPTGNASAETLEIWWVLFALGAVSGGLMALIGGGAALLALPYCVVFLGYTGLGITPTMLLVTLINPVGAWMGFRSEGLLNREIALLFGGSAIIGGLLGPIVRVKLFHDPETFAALVGIALVLAAIEVFRGVMRPTAIDDGPNGARSSIETVAATGRCLTVSYRSRQWDIPVAQTLMMGAMIGIVSSAIGLGGGFLLIPLLTIMYRMPLQLVAAASIPYIIALSCSALLTYGLLVPVFNEPTVMPDWAFGLFIASGGAIGSWIGAKLQQVIPPSWLNLVLGLSVGGAGVVYVAKAVLKL